LLKDGVRVKIEPKPFEVLLALLERPGEVIERDALYARLWSGVSADYRRGLDTAVKKLRQALKGSDDTQEYIETLPKRGYRLIVQPAETSGSSGELLRAPSATTAVSEGRRLYLQGNHCWNKRTPASLRAALSYFQRAHEQEPQNGEYLAAIAYTYMWMTAHGMGRPIEIIARAKTAAANALQYNPSQALARTVLAAARGIFEYELRAGAAELGQIVTANPENPLCCLTYSFALAALGQHAESRATIEKAHLMDPVSPIIKARRGFCAYLARDFDEAVTLGEEAVTRDPEFGLAHFYLGQALLAKNKHQRAIHHLRKADTILEECSATHAVLGLACAAVANFSKAERIDNELTRVSPPEHADRYHWALLKWALGRKEEAVDLVDGAHSDHSPWFALAAVDPKWDEIREHPRARTLVRRLKR
jgi:DNA-binding winged helix-turn-helix (wHTH) protein/Flp pilus assembly protein TadD